MLNGNPTTTNFIHMEMFRKPSVTHGEHGKAD